MFCCYSTSYQGGACVEVCVSTFWPMRQHLTCAQQKETLVCGQDVVNTSAPFATVTLSRHESVECPAGWWWWEEAGGGGGLALAARSCATRPVPVVRKAPWPGCGAVVVVSPLHRVTWNDSRVIKGSSAMMTAPRLSNVIMCAGLAQLSDAQSH